MNIFSDYLLLIPFLITLGINSYLLISIENRSFLKKSSKKLLMFGFGLSFVFYLVASISRPVDPVILEQFAKIYSRFLNDPSFGLYSLVNYFPFNILINILYYYDFMNFEGIIFTIMNFILLGFTYLICYKWSYNLLAKNRTRDIFKKLMLLLSTSPIILLVLIQHSPSLFLILFLSVLSFYSMQKGHNSLSGLIMGFLMLFNFLFFLLNSLLIAYFLIKKEKNRFPYIYSSLYVIIPTLVIFSYLNWEYIIGILLWQDPNPRLLITNEDLLNSFFLDLGPIGQIIGVLREIEVVLPYNVFYAVIIIIILSIKKKFFQNRTFYEILGFLFYICVIFFLKLEFILILIFLFLFLDIQEKTFKKVLNLFLLVNTLLFIKYGLSFLMDSWYAREELYNFLVSYGIVIYNLLKGLLLLPLIYSIFKLRNEERRLFTSRRLQPKISP